MAKKILLIEDEANIRAMYSDILTEEGYEVIGEGDGLKGLEKIMSGDWDLLLLDIMLPKMDGVEMLKRIQEEQKNLGKPIVILTNLEDAQIKDTCLKLGAKEFLVKSNIVPGDVVLTVEKYTLNE